MRKALCKETKQQNNTPVALFSVQTRLPTRPAPPKWWEFPTNSNGLGAWAGRRPSTFSWNYI